MTILPPSDQGVSNPPIPNCPSCGRLLGLYYAECPTCAHHASDYTFGEYADALDGGA